MRDDVKIGILLGFVLVLFVFIYFFVIHAGGESDNQAVELVDEGDRGTVAQSAVPPSRTEQPNPGPLPAAGGATDHAAGPGNDGQAAGSAIEQPVEPATPAAMPRHNPTRDWGTSPQVRVEAPPSIPPAVTVAAAGAGVGAETVAGGMRPGMVIGGEETRPLTELHAGTAADAGTGAGVAGENVLPDGTKLYKVQQGDSAWRIAQEHYGRGSMMNLLMAANPEVNWTNLRLGATIKIPPAPAAATTGGGAGPAVTGVGPAEAALGPNEYRIKEGDMLGSIAQQFYGRSSLWTRITDANPGLDPRNLPVGKVITIPPAPAATTGGGATGSTGASTAGDQPLTPGTYRVKEGDSLWKIAAEQLGNGARHDELFQLNKDVIGDSPDNLKPGMVLKLPAARSGSSRLDAPTRRLAPSAGVAADRRERV